MALSPELHRFKEKRGLGISVHGAAGRHKLNETLTSSVEPAFPALRGSVKKVPFGWFGAVQTEMKTIWWAGDRGYVYYSNFACGLERHEKLQLSLFLWVVIRSPPSCYYNKTSHSSFNLETFNQFHCFS